MMKDSCGFDYEVYDNKKILFMLNNSCQRGPDALVDVFDQSEEHGYISGINCIGRNHYFAKADDTPGLISCDGNDELRNLMDLLYELKDANKEEYAKKPILIQTQLLSFAHFDWCMTLGFRVYIGRWYCTKESFKESEINDSYKLNVLEIKPGMTEDNKDIRWAHNISRLIVAGHFDTALYKLWHNDYLDQLRSLYADCQKSIEFQKIMTVLNCISHVAETSNRREVIEYEKLTNTYELRKQ